jgi:hypothetical protein
MRWRRESAGLVGALLLHAAAFAWLTRLAPATRDARDSDRTPIDLDLDTVPVADALPTVPGAMAASPIESRPASTIGRATDHPSGRAPPREPGEPLAPSPGESGSAFVFNPAVPGLTNRTLGLDGHNLFLSGLDRPDGAAPSSEPEANVAPGVDRSMHDALQARDHALGLDVGGPLLAIAEELTRPSATPVDGRAVLEVTLDEAGAVTGVRVVDAASERLSWDRLASQMATAFRSRRVALRTKGRGMVVTMEVSSRWALPSGQPAGRAVTDPYVKPGEGAGTYVVAGGHFDLSDIGARPHRDVHARILHEEAR